MNVSLDYFFDSVQVEEDGAYDGKRCIKLTTTDPKFPAGLRRIDNIRIPNVIPTFSVYLKAAEENTDVVVSVSAQTKKVKVGKTWSRHSVSYYKPLSITGVGVSVKSKGVVWVDAAQLELSDKATEYTAGPTYSEENWLGKKEPVPTEFTVIKVPKVTGAVEVDGVLDEAAWKSAPMVNLRVLKTLAAPKEATTCRLLCDDKNLYAGFECTVAAGRVIPADAATKAKSPWATDNVEVLVDPTAKRKGSFQFATNLAGAKGSSRGRMGKSTWYAWKGEWNSAGRREATKYTIEVAIPFSTLEINGDTPRRWPINLARTNPAMNEFVSSTRAKISFHEVERFNLVELPADLDLKPFAVGVRGDRLVAGETEGVFSYAGKLANETSADGTFKVELTAPGMKAPLARAIKVSAGDAVLFKMGPVPLAAGRKRAKVRVRIHGGNGELLTTSERTVMPTSGFMVYPALSYFSDEKNLTVYGERSFVPEGGAKIKGEAVLYRDGKQVAKATDSTAGKRLRFDFPMAGLSGGSYKVKVKTSGVLTATDSAETVVREHVPGETKIDHLRRCVVVDGKPTVVFSPLAMSYYKLNEDFFRLFAENNMPHLSIALGRPHPHLMDDYLDMAARVGARIIYFQKVNPEYVKHPALMGWLVVDEPAGEARAQEVKDEVAKSRKLDPNHFIYCNHFPHTMAANYAGLPGDIISIDYYPIPVPGRSIKGVGELTRKMEELATPRRLPTWFFVQGSGLHAREPYAEEYEAQTYMVLVNGGTGVKWFFGMPSTRKEWKRFVGLAAEVKTLNDVLLSVEPRPGFTQQYSIDISATSRLYKGSAYVIAVNGSREPVDEIFKLPGVSGTAEVLFENRKLEVKDGRLADTFKPLQRHVYKIDLR